MSCVQIKISREPPSIFKHQVYSQILMVKNSRRKSKEECKRHTEDTSQEDTGLQSSPKGQMSFQPEKKIRKNVFHTGKWQIMGAEQIYFQ